MIKDYSKYSFSVLEVVGIVLKGVAAGLIVGYLFFDKIIFGIILIVPFVLFLFKVDRKKKISKRLDELNGEFRDALCSMASAIEAGYSAEGALGEAEKDMRLMYGEKAMIADELRYILRKIKNGGTVEEAFEEFAARSGSEDAKNFAEAFATIKRSGGELCHVINMITGVMQEKQEAKRDIDLLIAAKRYEVIIMKYMPPAIILYLRLTSPDFILPLYQGGGRLFVAVIIPVWLGLIYISEKIMDIDI